MPRARRLVNAKNRPRLDVFIMTAGNWEGKGKTEKRGSGLLDFNEPVFPAIERMLIDART
jgi:hypothetical protein